MFNNMGFEYYNPQYLPWFKSNISTLDLKISGILPNAFAYFVA